MNRLAVLLGDKGQADLSGVRARKLLLGNLRRLAHAPQCDGVPTKVHAVYALEFVDQPAQHALVEVVAAQVVVAGGGQHLDHAFTDLDDGYIECAAAQIIDHDLLRCAVVQAIGQRCTGGLVDDALDVQSCDAPGILGGLTLDVIEVGGHRNHGVGDRFAQVGLRVLLEPAEDQRADLLRRPFLPIDPDAPISSHLPLDRADGAVGVDGLLALGGAAHQHVALLREGHHAGRAALASVVGDDDRMAAFHDGNTAVGGAQVDADDPAHICKPPIRRKTRTVRSAAASRRSGRAVCRRSPGRCS